MTNLTISVNDEVLNRARIRALEENRSVNAILGQYLRDYARADDIQRRRREALNALLALADRCRCGSGGKTWSRNDLHNGETFPNVPGVGDHQ